MSERQNVAAQLVMKEVEAFRRRRADIAETARLANEQLAKDIEAFKRLVMHGKATTGDRITDYFLAVGCIDEGPSAPFRDVAARLKGKKDQLVLIVQRKRERHVFGSPGHSSESDYHLETTHTLGILSDDELVLDFKKRSCGLPTEAYTAMGDRRPMEKKTGPFVFNAFCGLDRLGKPISASHDSGSELELRIGCKEVFDYSPYPYAGRMKSRPASWVCALNPAIRLLGRDIPEAPEEKAAREAEQQDVLGRLDKKRELYKSLGFGGSRMNQKTCKEELNILIARAKELGLGDHPLVRLVLSETQ